MLEIGDELDAGAVTDRAGERGRHRLRAPGRRVPGREQPQGHFPGPRGWPGTAPALGVGGHVVGQARARGEETGDRAAGTGDGAGAFRWVDQGDGDRRPGAGHATRDRPRIVGPVEVDEPVGQGRAQVPAIGGAGRGVGRGDDPDFGREGEAADAAFEDDPEESGLDGGRGGGQLVEEHDALTGLGEANGPIRRGHGHAVAGRVVADDRQACEVRRLVDAGDDGFEGNVQPAGQLVQGGGLADARLSPQENGQVRRDGEREGLELRVAGLLGAPGSEGLVQVVGRAKQVIPGQGNIPVKSSYVISPRAGNRITPGRFG